MELRPTPRPAAGELLVATKFAGLCGTDIQMLRGLRDDAAEVIGHEGIATVISAGAGAGPGPGTEVVVNPTHPSSESFLLGHNVNGLLQERTLVPRDAVEAGLVLPLETAPEPELAALLEPLAVVRYALSALQRFRPETLVVFGGGTVGRLAIRAAHRWLGPAVRTVLVHRGAEPGLTGAHTDIRTDDLGAVRGSVAVLVATPRDGTVECLRAALGMSADSLVVDLVGGLSAGAEVPELPGVDLAAVRAANRTGFPDPPSTYTGRAPNGGHVRLFGHRGVSAEHLRAAAAELVRDPGRYRDVITHVTGLGGAARIMRDLARGGDRIVDGRRLVKLAVRVGDP